MKKKLKTFKDLKHVPHAMGCGTMSHMMFDNGYGVSVVRTQYTYGGEEGLRELAVIKGTEEDWHLCYDTEITEDVIGHLTEDKVSDYMKQVQNLEPLHLNQSKERGR